MRTAKGNERPSSLLYLGLKAITLPPTAGPRVCRSSAAAVADLPDHCRAIGPSCSQGKVSQKCRIRWVRIPVRSLLPLSHSRDAVKMVNLLIYPNYAHFFMYHVCRLIRITDISFFSSPSLLLPFAADSFCFHKFSSPDPCTGLSRGLPG